MKNIFLTLILSASIVGCSQKEDSSKESAQNEQITSSYNELRAGFTRAGYTIDQESISMEADVGSTVVQKYYVFSQDRTEHALNLQVSPVVSSLSVTTDCNPIVKRRDTCFVTISYSPSQVENASTVVSFFESAVSVSLKGVDANALSDSERTRIRLSTNVIDFGDIQEGQSLSQALSVNNRNRRTTLTPIASGLSSFTFSSGTCGETVTPYELCNMGISFTAPTGTEGNVAIQETMTLFSGMEVVIKANVIKIIDPNACIPYADLKIFQYQPDIDLTDGSKTVKVLSLASKVGKVCVENNTSNFTVTGCETALKRRQSCDLTISSVGTITTNVSENISINTSGIFSLKYFVPNICVLPAVGTIDPVTLIDNTNGRIAEVGIDQFADCVVLSCDDLSYYVGPSTRACFTNETPPAPTTPTYDSGLQYDSGVVYQ
jgi:hypothetical protein